MSRVDRRLNRMSVPSAGHGGKAKRAMGVQRALEWAFRIEKAQLELPLPENMTEEGFGFGLEYVLLQRAALGCKVDGGQHKISGFTHEDAEVIAATVAGLADSLGGKRMANQAITPAPLSNGRIDHLRSSSPHSAADTSPWPQSGTICAASKPTHWQRHTRGALSQLPMTSGPWIWQPTDQARPPAQLDFFEGSQP